MRTGPHLTHGKGLGEKACEGIELESIGHTTLGQDIEL